MLRSLVGCGPAIPAIPAGGVAGQSGGGVGLRGVAAVAGIAFLMVFAGVALSGCLEDGDSSDDSGLEFGEGMVTTGPHILSLPEDQNLIGAFYEDSALHRVYLDGDSIMMHNNNSGDSTEVYTYEGPVARSDVAADTLVTNDKETNDGGLSYGHTVLHINLSTGEETVVHSTRIYGGSSEDDEYITLASAVDHVAYLFNEGDGTWEVDIRDLDNNQRVAEHNVVVDRVLSADAEMNGDLIGFIDQSNQLKIYTLVSGTVGDYNKTVVENAKDVAFSGSNIAVVDNEGLKLSTFDDPDNFTLVPGTEGADAVSIFGDYKLLSMGDDLFLFDKDNRNVQIYDRQVTDIWLEESEGLFSASGTYNTPETDGDDIGHLNVELVSEEA